MKYSEAAARGLQQFVVNARAVQVIPRRQASAIRVPNHVVAVVMKRVVHDGAH